MSSITKRVAIVTGASSGIGLVAARTLANAGYQVFGTSRTQAADQPGITMLVADVTDDASVRAMVDEVSRRTGRVDLVVNNAGVGLSGGAEESSIQQAKHVFDINMFGVARVVNAVLPIMRAQKGGRIVNVSSVLGLIPAPFSAYYAATKHALEGYSESLDHEVREHGIRVLLVEPGVTRTAFEENLNRADTPLPVYEARRRHSETLMRTWQKTADDPQVVADVILVAATAKMPQLRYAAGKQARQVSLLRRFVPAKIIDKSFRKFNELT